MENVFVVLTLSMWEFVRVFAEARAADEILWMNGATWVQLWSGIIGAVIGSAAAALVAGFVLRKTLAEQRNLATQAQVLQEALAERQLQEQRTALAKQLEEQRAGLERQLEEQRSVATAQLHEQRQGLERQLREQRREASLNREHAAISDLIALLSDTIALKENTPESNDAPILTRLASGIVRWQLESTNPALRAELQRWPALWQDSMRVFRRREMFDISQTEARRLLALTNRDMLSFSRDWTQASPQRQARLLAKMQEARDRIPRPEEAITATSSSEA